MLAMAIPKILCMALGIVCLARACPAFGQSLPLILTKQVETAPKSGCYHRLESKSDWTPSSTVLILCDVWDLHHSKRAVDRLEEIIPRLDQTASILRDLGVTIIHAPSGCMSFYEDHPARARAIGVPAASAFPDDVSDWCKQIPAEEKINYPIDQSDGGEDDKPADLEEWAAELTTMGKNPRAPWTRQHRGIAIDAGKDFISDDGKEIWSILTDRQIDNVILAGVHTNMCILGRPFGLRRMVLAGKNATLLRDLTDTMYDPQDSPFVNHFTGTDLIIDHIERHVCPTISSEQILGGEPFRFAEDKRPTVAFLIGDDEYSTHETLPAWALKHLGKDYRMRFVYGSHLEPSSFPGIEKLKDADLLVISVRRRPMRQEMLQCVREFEASGKPMLGIRTASHAFSLRNPKKLPAEIDSWPEFDAAVWGGSYTNHHANDAHPRISHQAKQVDHPILAHWPDVGFTSRGSLYKVQPVAPNAEILAIGSITNADANAEPEPVLWTFKRSNGGSSVYTSLGHPADFEEPSFQVLLKNSVDWLIGAR